MPINDQIISILKMIKNLASRKNISKYQINDQIISVLKIVKLLVFIKIFPNANK